MFVLKSRITGYYLRRNSNYSFTPLLREARVFSRTSDYKQSNAWLGRFVPRLDKYGDTWVTWTDKDRPVEAVRVELAIVKNPNLKDVEITIS